MSSMAALLFQWKNFGVYWHDKQISERLKLADEEVHSNHYTIYLHAVILVANKTRTNLKHDELDKLLKV